MLTTKTCTAAAVVAACAASAAAVPLELTHQGRFTSVNGAAVSGDVPTQQQFLNFIFNAMDLFDPATAQLMNEGFGTGLSIGFTDNVFNVGQGQQRHIGVTFTYTMTTAENVATGLLDILPQANGEIVEVAHVNVEKFQTRQQYGQVQQQSRLLTDPGIGGNLNQQVWELTFVSDGTLAPEVLDIINGGPEADLEFIYAVTPAPAAAMPLILGCAALRRRTNRS